MARKSEVNVCQYCANWGTLDCPTSSKCFALPDKPYWKARYTRPTIKDILKRLQDENKGN